MKVDYISDLHINHYILFKNNQIKWEKRTKEWARRLFETKNGEILVIAGDFSEWNRQTIWFLEEAGAIYEQVFFVTGNHDYYLLSKSRKRKYRSSKNRQLSLIESAKRIQNVQPLCREVINYKGRIIAGDSLWYLPKTESEWSFFFNFSSDSDFIYIPEACSLENNSKKDEIRYLYEEAMSWYNTLDGRHIDLMISHIPPIHPPISSYPRNACYDCSVPFLASEQWICGHQHLQGSFKITGTNFWMNAIGYPNERNKLELKTIEI